MIPKKMLNFCAKTAHILLIYISRYCSFTNEDDEGNGCECRNPQYYNTIVSDKHIGWIEIHCNSCGTLIGFINSTVENIYDFTTLCSNCIIKAGHPE